MKDLRDKLLKVVTRPMKVGEIAAAVGRKADNVTYHLRVLAREKKLKATGRSFSRLYSPPQK